MARHNFNVKEIGAIEGAVFKSQRSEKGLAYEAFIKRYNELKNSRDPKHIAMFKAWNEDLRNAPTHEPMLEKGVDATSVHSNTFLSNLSIQYANDAFIGEQLLTLVPVDKRTDKYAIYPQRERLEVPSALIGARGEVNEIDETRTSSTYSVLDYGYKNSVTQETLSNEDPIFDEMVDLTESINELLAFDREKRLASLFTTAANFGSNTTTLSGSDQWDSAGGGDPIKDIQTARAAIWNSFGPSRLVGYCSISVFAMLSRHPALLDLLKYTKGGLASRQALAQYFELDDLLVGSARKQTANEGQTAAYSRVWGNDFGIVRVSQRASKRSAGFASMFRIAGDPLAVQWRDSSKGRAGIFYSKVAVSEVAQAVAASSGYLIKSAVATSI